MSPKKVILEDPCKSSEVIFKNKKVVPKEDPSKCPCTPINETKHQLEPCKLDTAPLSQEQSKPKEDKFQDKNVKCNEFTGEHKDREPSSIPNPLILKTNSSASTKKEKLIDPCAQYYPFKDHNISQFSNKMPTVYQSNKPIEISYSSYMRLLKSVGVLKDKLKFPPDIKHKMNKIHGTVINRVKEFIPKVNYGELKNIEYKRIMKYGLHEASKFEYKKWIQYKLCKIKYWIRNNWDSRKMADKGSGTPSRPMKYPYTFSAKIAQFPLGHYVKNQWIWKYYLVAFAACVPVFYSIHKLSNSPGNVAKWAEIRRKEAAEHHH